MNYSSYHFVLHIQSSRSSRSISKIEAIGFYLNAAAVNSRIVHPSLVDLLEEGSFQYFSCKSCEGSSPHIGSIVSITQELI